MKLLLAMKSVLLRDFSGFSHLLCSDVRDWMRTGVLHVNKDKRRLGFTRLFFDVLSDARATFNP
jgi:hypothetical protein